MRKQTSKNVRRALEDTLQKLANDIKTVRSKGGFPHDYSLGFTNGLIFVLNRMSNRQRAFFDRKTEVGNLPKPVVFEHEKEENEAEMADYNRLMDDVVYAVESLRGMPVPVGMTKEDTEKWQALWAADLKLQEFLTEKEKRDESCEMESGAAGDEEPPALGSSDERRASEGTELHEDRPPKSRHSSEESTQPGA